MPQPTDSDQRPLAVFLPEGGEGYVMRVDVARPKVARDGRVHTRRTFKPHARTAPKWYIYSEHPIDGPTVGHAIGLLRNFVAWEKKRGG